MFVLSNSGNGAVAGATIMGVGQWRDGSTPLAAWKVQDDNGEECRITPNVP